MTKRKTTQKPNTAGAATPTVNSTSPVSPVENVKAESNTVVAPKHKQANSKAPAKPRGRPKKKVIIEQVYEVLEPKGEVTYVAPNRAILVADKPPSLYSRFKAWLVFKLYHYTSYFRGF